MHSCQDNSICRNTIGSFNCPCDSGYHGDGKSSCVDIDECTNTTVNHNCHQNATCMNTNGSFWCDCNVGYSGNGTSCTDIIECNTGHACDSKANCTNTDGSFICVCHVGYVGNGRNCSGMKVHKFCHDLTDSLQ